LSFAIHFLNVDDYYDPPAIRFKTEDFLNKAGTCGNWPSVL
jgi:hypothetical protein